MQVQRGWFAQLADVGGGPWQRCRRTVAPAGLLHAGTQGIPLSLGQLQALRHLLHSGRAASRPRSQVRSTDQAEPWLSVGM